MLNLNISFYLIAMGFLVGILSSFFGFGGGFILTPFLISLGFPANTSVGTSITEVLMSSLVASLSHRRLGNVEVKLGLIIALTSILGTEFGAQLIEQLKRVSIQHMNSIVSLVYILILVSISTYMIHEDLSSNQEARPEKKKLLWLKIREIKVPPLIKVLQSDTESLSIWVVIAIGFIRGLLAGFLGAGGGFILTPLLVYVVGCKPPVAAGTCIFGISVSCAYASLTHILKGNVNFTLVILIFIGSSIGVQIGALAAKRLGEIRFKMIFGLCLSFVSLSVAMKFISCLFGLFILEFLSHLIIFLTVLFITLFILILFIRRLGSLKSLKHLYSA